MSHPARPDSGLLSRITQAPVLESALDASVNFVNRGEYPGAIEARYVRRDTDEVIIYLSSQTGCAKACRFCHLTQSGQTQGVDLSVEDYVAQAEQVLSHYDQLLTAGQPAAKTANFNFMARGEVFANQAVLSEGDRLLEALAACAVRRRLLPRFKFSTIMPAEMNGRQLAWLFPAHAPDIYYSLYSVDPAWRRRWMPKALGAEQALGMLADYQQVTRKMPVIHFALIEGENDSPQQMQAIADAIETAGLRCDINLVRYNPFSDRQGREPAQEVIAACAQTLAARLAGCRVQIVGRVGHDVKASCGMFVAGRGARKTQQLLNITPLASTASQFVGFGSA
jgi:adenine C2-methylase RlmN of 23S rRNA A2503 and tRNA A37